MSPHNECTLVLVWQTTKHAKGDAGCWPESSIGRPHQYQECHKSFKQLCHLKEHLQKEFILPLSLCTLCIHWHATVIHSCRKKKIRCSYVIVSNQSNYTSCSEEGNVCVATECKFLCTHMYSCDDACYDFKNGHICPHTHRVHSLAVQGHSSFHIPEEHSNSKEQSMGTCIRVPSISLHASTETAYTEREQVS